MNGSVGWGDLLRVAGALAILGPLAYLAARLVAARPARRSRPSVLRLVETLPIGPGQTVHLISVGRRLLVVGATGSQLTCLDRLGGEDDPQAVEALLAEAGVSPGRPGRTPASPGPFVSWADRLRMRRGVLRSGRWLGW